MPGQVYQTVSERKVLSERNTFIAERERENALSTVYTQYTVHRTEKAPFEGEKRLFPVSQSRSCFSYNSAGGAFRREERGVYVGVLCSVQ